ncbi:caspase family protein [Kaarinaea lacus]
MRQIWILALISHLLLSSTLAWANSPGNFFKYTSTELGEKYYYGLGVPQNYSEAFKNFLEAAEQGDSNAQVLVGYMYQEGQGVRQDYDKALMWYRKAVKQGNAYAQNSLGVMYDLGKGVPQDYGKAVNWFRKAAEQGHVTASANLGEYYEYGKGVKADIAKAFNYYQDAANHGHAESKKAVARQKHGIWGTQSLQKLLASQGYAPGPVDGHVGLQTIKAAEHYTKDAKIDNGPVFLTGVHNALFEQIALRSPSGTIIDYKTLRVKTNFGRYYALVIGNQNYKHIRKLKTTVNDAKKVANLLRTRYGFKVITLYDATRAEILDALTDLRRDLSPEDNLLIYYAGHGVIDPDTKRGYWQPIDADKENPANWIANDDITNQLKAMAAKHVLIVADSCYAGTLVRAPDLTIMRTGGEVEYVRRMAQRRSRTVLASGGLEPVVDVGKGNHSVFADAFIQTLQENDKIIDVDSLFEKIKRRVALQAKQTPLYSDIRFANHEDGDFVLVPK